ncbi:MAG: universal stress protein [Nitrospirae bacterium]|nr:universal stress protein [Nitrospirota bacterium]
MKMLIAYDGTINAKNALRYGLGRLKAEGGSAVVLHLFHSALFVDYGAGPNAESMARAESARRLAEARRIVDEAGGVPWVRFEEKDGEPGEELLGYAGEVRFDVILAPAKYASVSDTAPCPVITFPGTILVPVDSTGYGADAIGRILAEARATGSRAVLLGVLPVHMYAASESAELKKVESETRAYLKEIGKALKKEGVETVEAMRPGYPDEEILRAMDEFRVSMVVIPTAEDSPSEVAKASSMIREEEGKAGRRILLGQQ